ncbi:RNA recognition motif domain [Trypanosoma melophagium]|uniref:RNA recognition motif domain n=1 Tax=Trypanosoma melophagium TaxID=715481 RepID=UPI00351A6A23|nr:RNA recognition motif domain [Trypanosoma melophagium]
MVSDPRNLIVNYIPTPVTDAELRRLFEPFGPVETARVIRDRANNHPKGYGFVRFRSEAAAQEAIGRMNGYEIYNKRLRVDIARGPQSKCGNNNNNNNNNNSNNRGGSETPVLSLLSSMLFTQPSLSSSSTSMTYGTGVNSPVHTGNTSHTPNNNNNNDSNNNNNNNDNNSDNNNIGSGSIHGCTNGSGIRHTVSESAEGIPCNFQHVKLYRIIHPIPTTTTTTTTTSNGGNVSLALPDGVPTHFFSPPRPIITSTAAPTAPQQMMRTTNTNTNINTDTNTAAVLPVFSYLTTHHTSGERNNPESSLMMNSSGVSHLNNNNINKNNSGVISNADAGGFSWAPQSTQKLHLFQQQQQQQQQEERPQQLPSFTAVVQPLFFQAVQLTSAHETIVHIANSSLCDSHNSLSMSSYGHSSMPMGSLSTAFCAELIRNVSLI